jgi:hypothetical protein
MNEAWQLQTEMNDRIMERFEQFQEQVQRSCPIEWGNSAA